MESPHPYIHRLAMETHGINLDHGFSMEILLCQNATDTP